MTARRYLAAAVLTVLFIAILAIVGWAAEHAPTWLALIVIPAAVVVFWRLWRADS